MYVSCSTKGPFFMSQPTSIALARAQQTHFKVGVLYNVSYLFDTPRSKFLKTKKFLCCTVVIIFNSVRSHQRGFSRIMTSRNEFCQKCVNVRCNDFPGSFMCHSQLLNFHSSLADGRKQRAHNESWLTDADDETSFLSMRGMIPSSCQQ